MTSLILIRTAGLALAALAATTAGCATRAAPEGAPPAPPLLISPFGRPVLASPTGVSPVRTWFDEVDQDRDGRVTFDEFRADATATFELFDLNRDGEIGASEIAAYEAGIDRLMGPADLAFGGAAGRRPPRGGPPPRMNLEDADTPQSAPPGGGMPGGGMPGAGGPPPNMRAPRAMLSPPSRLALLGLINVSHPVRAADADLNQRITADEFEAVADRWFTLLDVDRDGVLTFAELPPQVIFTLRQGGRGPR